MSAMERITRKDIDQYKQQILDETVLVDVKATAAILSVSESTVIRRAEDGSLTPYRPPGNRNDKGLRFLASELREYVRQMRDDVVNA